MATISFAQAGPSRLTAALPRLVARVTPPRFGTTVDRSIVVLGAISPAALDVPARVQTSLQSLVDSLVELFPPFLLAVPKKKVSHSRKSMRSAHKGLKNKTSSYRPVFYQHRYVNAE